MLSIAGLALLVAGAPVTVTIPGLGTVIGTTTIYGSEFKGIPYAQPPTGLHRWQPPRAALPWGQLNTTRYGAHCMQHLDSANPVWPDTNISEDCLFLNIFTPDRPDKTMTSSPSVQKGTANMTGTQSLAPVLLYLHGGGFTSGGGNETRLRAGFAVNHLADAGKRLVVVTLNYRLGIFGYLGAEPLRDVRGSAGNWGTLDQRQAMQFVRDHISVFGGDPDRVLLAGQSAGAASVSAHLVSAGSFGLFRRAGMMSGALPTWITQSWDDAATSYQALLGAANCTRSYTPVACLRGVSSAAMLGYDDVAVNGWGPTIDGAELPERPWVLAAAGKVAPGVDALIAGNTAEDGGGGIAQWAERDAFQDWVASSVFRSNKSLAHEVERLYPTWSEVDRLRDGMEGCTRWYWAQKHLLRDAEMACPARRTAFWFGDKDKGRGRSNGNGGGNGGGNGAATYLYQFDHVPRGTAQGEGASHSSDIPFVFHVTETDPGEADPQQQGQTIHGDAERALSSKMLHRWFDIASTGRPTSGYPWPAYTNATRETLVFNVDGTEGGGVRVVRGLHETQCAFWDKYIALAPVDA